jgi:cytoskeleton protein RodZ
VFEIGATLREARVRNGLTLVQVAEDTKIRSKYLQALENEEFGDLPGEAYAKGFLRSYATYLGLDAQVILDEYSSRYGGAQGASQQLEGPSALRRPARARRSGLLFVALLAVLILAVIYVLGLRGDSGDKTPTTNPSALTRSPSPVASSSRPITASPNASSTIAADLTILKLAGSAKPCYVTVYQNSQSTTPKLAATFATGVTHTLHTRGTFIVVLGGDPSSITMIVNGRHERTAGDPSGTVYRITKGKVTRE